MSNNFEDVTIVHAAVNGGMMANFGRIFAAGLVAQGASMHFFASKYPVFGWPPPVQELELIGGKFHGLPLPESFSPFHEMLCVVQMTVALRRLNVKVLHTRGSVMGFVGRLAGKLAGVPIIYHHQDDLFCRDANLSPRMKRITGFIESQLARLTDMSFFVSQAVLDDAVKIGFPPGKCVLVGHDLNEVYQKAVTEAIVKGDRNTFLFEKLGIPRKMKLVGFVGRLAHLKGADIFLNAAERLAQDFPDWSFVIKGDGPMREAIEKEILSKGLSKRIFLMTDELPYEELPAVYRSFDIFALPTRREGFGMVFAEAMAMGVAVVAPNIPPVNEVVHQDHGILFDAENVDSFIHGLELLMRDDEFRCQVARKGQQYALDHWCGKQAAEKVIAAYKSGIHQKLGIEQ